MLRQLLAGDAVRRRHERREARRRVGQPQWCRDRNTGSSRHEVAAAAATPIGVGRAGVQHVRELLRAHHRNIRLLGPRLGRSAGMADIRHAEHDPMLRRLHGIARDGRCRISKRSRHDPSGGWWQLGIRRRDDWILRAAGRLRVGNARRPGAHSASHFDPSVRPGVRRRLHQQDDPAVRHGDGTLHRDRPRRHRCTGGPHDNRDDRIQACYSRTASRAGRWSEFRGAK